MQVLLLVGSICLIEPPSFKEQLKTQVTRSTEI